MTGHRDTIAAEPVAPVLRRRQRADLTAEQLRELLRYQPGNRPVLLAAQARSHDRGNGGGQRQKWISPHLHRRGPLRRASARLALCLRPPPGRADRSHQPQPGGQSHRQPAGKLAAGKCVESGVAQQARHPRRSSTRLQVVCQDPHMRKGMSARRIRYPGGGSGRVPGRWDVASVLLGHDPPQRSFNKSAACA